MLEEFFLFLAGVTGGMVNSIAGGGSFITFPALIAAGVPPIAANATNTFASCAGYLGGAAGFRRELWTHRAALPRIVLCAALGGGCGAWLLLQTPAVTFSRVIPWLLLLATILLVWGEPLQHRWRREGASRSAFARLTTLLLTVFLLLVCTYGGFFNAGLGIILLGYLTFAGYQDIHLMNGLKLLISAVVALWAIVVFGAGDLIAWREGGIVMAGTLVGGYSAARSARLVNPERVRQVIIAVAGGMTAYFFIWG